MADMSKINFNIDGVNNEYNIKDKKAREEIAINKSDILSVSNDTEINSLTLGTKVAKNLFNKDGQINIRYNGIIESDEGKKNTVNNNIVTFNTSTSTDKGTGQIIRGLKNKKVIISCECVSVGTSSSNKGKLIIYKRNSGTELAYEFIELGDFVFEYDCGDNDELLFAFVVNGSGAGLQLKNIMIRSAEFANPMYVPYSTPTLPLQEQINDNTTDILTVINANGVKNILNYNLDSIKAINNGSDWVWSDNSVTNAGITFTINSDNTITAMGKLTDQQAYLRVLANFDISQGTWTLSGCPKGGSYSTYKMYIDGINGFSDYGNTLTKTLDSSTTATFLTIVVAGISDNINLLFKPMLCSSEIYNVSPNYQPYSLSNVELTALEKQNKNDILSLYKNSHNRGIASAKSNPNKWYKIGEYTANVTLNTTLLITSRYLDIQGLLTLTANISSTSSGTVWGSTALKTNWLGLRTITDNRSKYNITDIFKFGGTLTNGILHCELWVKIPTSWDIFSTVILHPNQNSIYSWEILSSDTAFDNYPEFEKISSPTDMLFDFETRLEALETALAQTTASE